ncbi:MAG: hypothetical protein K2N62_00570 [Desulfovibrio sp.]|nr:hypothetical protein [Desulfovibrio sp.]
MGFGGSRPFARVLIIPFLLVVLTTGVSGCAKSPDDSRSAVTLTGDLSTPIQIQTDNFVRRQPPVAYVSPTGPLGHRPKALFVPLRMVQQTTNAVTFSDLLSRQIWQVWLSLGAFQTLEYAPWAGPFERERALAIARQQGAELLVGGYINHFMDGGSGGESSVSLSMEVYDVKTGNLLWSLAEGGSMEARKTHDFYLFSITERNPADPSGLITRSLAWDMGRLILGWVDPSAVQAQGDISLWDKITGNEAF